MVSRHFPIMVAAGKPVARISDGHIRQRLQEPAHVLALGRGVGVHGTAQGACQKLGGVEFLRGHELFQRFYGI
jgi:hypothetical protein